MPVPDPIYASQPHHPSRYLEEMSGVHLFSIFRPAIETAQFLYILLSSSSEMQARDVAAALGGFSEGKKKTEKNGHGYFALDDPCHRC